MTDQEESELLTIAYLSGAHDAKATIQKLRAELEAAKAEGYEAGVRAALKIAKRMSDEWGDIQGYVGHAEAADEIAEGIEALLAKT